MAEIVQKKTVRYVSTGKPLVEEKDDELVRELREMRRANNPKLIREREFDRIAERREKALEVDPSKGHDEALKHFDTQFADIIADPVLNRRAKESYFHLAREAAATGAPVGWDKLRKMGNDIRVSVGRMTEEERERAEALAEMVRGRTLESKG